MKNIISVLNNWLQPKKQTILLFDSVAAASDIAFMLNADWDGCNGVLMPNDDEIAVKNAADLMQARWCYSGASFAILPNLNSDEFLRRYAAGERYFLNANLRCGILEKVNLSQANLSNASLNLANLSESNLSQIDLTAADLSEANLSGVNLSKADLTRVNLIKANLEQADLRNANLRGANLSQANLSYADLRGANLSLCDLRGANFYLCKLNGVNLTDAKFIDSDLENVSQE
jgi:uncharacterized protein YjbI with pentapeptide repeats